MNMFGLTKDEDSEMGWTEKGHGHRVGGELEITGGKWKGKYDKKIFGKWEKRVGGVEEEWGRMKGGGDETTKLTMPPWSFNAFFY